MLLTSWHTSQIKQSSPHIQPSVVQKALYVMIKYGLNVVNWEPPQNMSSLTHISPEVPDTASHDCNRSNTLIGAEKRILTVGAAQYGASPEDVVRAISLENRLDKYWLWFVIIHVIM